jgi:DNA-binding SARP family transcriptional activator
VALDFRLLGPLEVLVDGRPLRLGGPRQRAVLAMLLLQPNRVVSVERLADELYDGVPPATAVTQIQRQISELRALLGRALGPRGGEPPIETRPPGYAIRLGPDELDLHRFERGARRAREAADAGDAAGAVARYEEALGLWRGPPLADLAAERFARPAVERLEEIRLTVVEQQVEAELALGRADSLVPRLVALVDEHPFRERLRGQLMLALYRAGRQPEALLAFRSGRDRLVEAFGLEPSPQLRELEGAILRQDPSLDPPGPGRPDRRARAEGGAVLVVDRPGAGPAPLTYLARPLAADGRRELILIGVCEDGSRLAEATAAVQARGRELSAAGAPARVAAFTSRDPGRDVARLAGAHEVAIALVDAPGEFVADGAVPAELSALLDGAPCDVGILASTVPEREGLRVTVPFGGGEHDWAAAELAALLAAGAGLPLRLVGAPAPGRREAPDASRLLASASLAIQRLVQIDVEPVLADHGEGGLAAAVADSAVIVVGISPRWRQDGIGASRHALVRLGATPVMLVHRGPRPGALAPREAMTRYTWSLAPDARP